VGDRGTAGVEGAGFSVDPEDLEEGACAARLPVTLVYCRCTVIHYGVFFVFLSMR
jgi:hypothetical protein